MAGERSLRRKLIEIALAHRLEASLTKQQILELYLNVIYFGNGIYGVEAASRDLFGKTSASSRWRRRPRSPGSRRRRRHMRRAVIPIAPWIAATSCSP